MKSLVFYTTVFFAVMACFLFSCHDDSSSNEEYVYLFQTTDEYDGNLSSAASTGSVRGNVDQICATVKSTVYSHLPCANVKGFISIDSGDRIVDLSIPEDRIIVTPNKVLIASDRADLLDGSISETLAVLLSLDNWWWSGSNADGTLSPDGQPGKGTCSAWTSTEGGGKPGKQSGYNDDEDWISWTGGGATCGSSLYLMCVCW